MLEGKLTESAALQKQIATYAKTRAIYLEYRKTDCSKAFKSTHEADILLHQTAKKFLDEHGLQKLPTVASLYLEYAVVLEGKKTAYRDFRQARDEMRELLIIKPTSTSPEHARPAGKRTPASRTIPVTHSQLVAERLRRRSPATQGSDLGGFATNKHLAPRCLACRKYADPEMNAYALGARPCNVTNRRFYS